MVGLINLGAGLSQMGQGIASAATMGEQHTLDEQKMILANQLLEGTQTRLAGIQHGYELENIGAQGTQARETAQTAATAQGEQERETQEAANKLPMSEFQRAQTKAAQTQAEASMAEAQKPVAGPWGSNTMAMLPGSKWQFSAVAGNEGPDIASDPDLHGADFLEKVPSPVRNIVKMIGNGDMAPISGYSLSKPVAPGIMGSQVMNWVNQYNPKFSGTDMHTMQSARTAFINGQDGKTVTAFNALADHLATAQPMFDALKNGDIQLFNRAAQLWGKETGNPAPTNAKMAATLLGDEMARAVIGNGGGEGDRQQLQSIFANANSPEQIAGAFQKAQEFAAGKLRAEEQKYVANTKRTDFADQLRPNAQVILQNNPSPVLGEQGGNNQNANPASAVHQPSGRPMPKAGEVQKGYRFLGGDPANPKNWVKVNG